MRMFAIDNENTITAFPAAEQIPEGQQQFASEKDLATVTAEWPMERLVETWNSFAGVAGFGADLKPIKKFTDRKMAIKRIWTAIQKLDGDAPEAASTETAPVAEAAAAPRLAKGARTAAKVAPKKATPPKTARTTTNAPAAREGSKKALVLEMLRRKGGATLAEIMAATDWQAHSVRGFISGSIQKKMGLNVESSKNSNGERTYRIPK